MVVEQEVDHREKVEQVQEIRSKSQLLLEDELVVRRRIVEEGRSDRRKLLERVLC